MDAQVVTPHPQLSWPRGSPFAQTFSRDGLASLLGLMAT